MARAAILPEALRFHRLQVEHTIQAVTELFRPKRAADLDDSVIKACPCGNRFVIPPCPRCAEYFPESRLRRRVPR